MENAELIKRYFIPIETHSSLEDYGRQKENILVIAPHPDDDVLGVGGYMVKAAQEGKKVFTIYITDGAGSPRLDKKISDTEMASLREREAIGALRVLKAKGAFFLRLKSAELIEKSTNVKETLSNIVNFLWPDIIFIPAPYERHKTHLICTRLCLEALRISQVKINHLLGYSLWGNFWGGHRRIIADITPFIKDKVQAVLAHGSQLAYKNYHQGILGKNNYEAIFWESHGVQKINFAEIFLDMNILLQNPDLSLVDFIRQDMEAFINFYFSK